jgi:cytochrome c556
MTRILTVMTVGLLCLGGAASARGARTPAADIVEGRQAAMMLSGVAISAIKAAIDTGQPLAQQRFSTRALSRWAHAVPGMFPADSDAAAGVPTHARSEIWSDRAGFEARAADYAAAADHLAELATGEDTAAFAAQWAVVRQSCQACHDGYKAN